MFIKNREELTSHGDRRGRAMALDILEAGLSASDPYANTRSLIRIEGDRLLVGGDPAKDISGFGDEVIDLAEIDHIYVIGAGKAVQRQALALEDLLGDRLTAGAISIKEGEEVILGRIEVSEAAHPVPDRRSVEAADKIVEIARRSGKRDLVFTLFSDGASSLFVWPAPGLTIDDIRQVYFLAIKYGSQLVIHQVMPYFSGVKCGRITQMIHPARMVHQIMQVGLFDRWGGKLHSSGSWVPSWPPQRGRMPEAVSEMKRQPWWDELTPNLRRALQSGDVAYEVPDLEAFSQMRMSYWQPIDLFQMIEGARAKADQLGLHGVVLSSLLAAVSSSASNVLAQIAFECQDKGRPFEPPVALITGGHLDVPIGDATGIGGRNQEFALFWGRELGRGRLVSKRVVVAAMDSDGTDGPGTQHAEGQGEPVCMAGGLVDGYTVEEAEAQGLDLDAELDNHNSTPVLIKLESAIYTGNTGACLGDLRVAIVQ